MATREPRSTATSTSAKISSEPYDFDSPLAVSGVLPHGAGRAGNAPWPPCRRPGPPPGRRAASRRGGPCSARRPSWWPWPASCRPAPSARRPSSRRWPAPGGDAARRSRAAPGTSSSPRCRCRPRSGWRPGYQTLLTTASSSDTSWLITIEAALVAGQVAAQPGDRVGVEVVGGLVEQQDAAAVLAGVGEQDAGQLDAAALAAGEGADGLGQGPVGQAEVGADPGRLGLGRVAAQARRTGPPGCRSGGPACRRRSRPARPRASASRPAERPGRGRRGPGRGR